MAAGLIIITVGLAGGLLYKVDYVYGIDKKLFLKINQSKKLEKADFLFQMFYPLGTKWWFTAVILLFAFAVPSKGVFLMASAIVMSLTERLVKIYIKRPRPFLSLTDVLIRQRKRPSDGSFPSGDACRIWFLAVAALFVSHFNFLVASSAFILALIVSLGRLRLGVHYFSDVWAGSMLGAGFAAGCFLSCQTYINTI
ncbi:phosphatase PAP2 family protein [Flexistipes sinusarabici]|nr:phosphatase PAP2 family protein [Flexistipes sinusarabici]